MSSLFTGYTGSIIQTVLFVLIINLIIRLSLRFMRKHFDKQHHDWLSALMSAASLPLRYAFWILGLAYIAYLTADEYDYENAEYFQFAFQIAIVLCIGWFAQRFIKRATNILVHIVENQKVGPSETATVKAIMKLIEVVTYIVMVLTIMSILDISVSGLVTFGGVSAAALAFSTKDLIGNFFGGLMIYLDRPFAVGDWIYEVGHKFEGTVESIGWRLTIVRGFDKRPIYVPNSSLSTMTVVNASRMSHRRIKSYVGVRYGDIKVIPEIIEDIKQYLNDHPVIDKNAAMLVNISEFAESSINIMIYCMSMETRWAPFMDLQDSILLDISEIVEKHGAEYAFPTTTVHIPDGIQTDLPT